jgi:integrase
MFRNQLLGGFSPARSFDLEQWQFCPCSYSPLRKEGALVDPRTSAGLLRPSFELGDIPKNPTLLWEKVKVKNQGLNVNPLEPKEYAALLKAGVDIRKVSKALGHSSVTITGRYYAKWNKALSPALLALP